MATTEQSRMVEHYLSDAHEFMAGVHSDAEFQAMLKGIRYGKGTLFQRVLKAIRNLFRAERHLVSPNLFEAVMDLDTFSNKTAEHADLKEAIGEDTYLSVKGVIRSMVGMEMTDEQTKLGASAEGLKERNVSFKIASVLPTVIMTA